jgi:hypothetical protein
MSYGSTLTACAMIRATGTPEVLLTTALHCAQCRSSAEVLWWCVAAVAISTINVIAVRTAVNIRHDKPVCERREDG